jgi:hypothetical protein
MEFAVHQSLTELMSEGSKSKSMREVGVKIKRVKNMENFYIISKY